MTYSYSTGFGAEGQHVKCHPHHMVWRGHTVSVTHPCQPWPPDESVSVRFPTVKLSVLLLYMHCSVGGASVPGLHLEGQPLDASLPWAWSIHVNYSEFFCTEDLSFLFHLFTYLIMSMNSWRFMLWVLIQYFVLLLRLFQLWAIRNSFSCFLCPMNKAFYLFSFFQALSYFLTLQDTLDSSCVFSATDL